MILIKSLSRITTSIEGIKTLDFMSRNENLILYGRNGAGKSHMATAIGVEACMHGKKVKFYKTAALIDRLVHHSHLIIFNRDSWRFEHSLMKNSATQ
jgi:DNA replication protein DnaC